jgi:hypothetical protein
MQRQSANTSGGWQGQYERREALALTRPEDRQTARKGGTEHEHDFVCAFFQNCYHLRDWLFNSGPYPRASWKIFSGSTSRCERARMYATARSTGGLTARKLIRSSPSVSSTFPRTGLVTGQS